MVMLRIYVTWLCPHCGRKQQTLLEVENLTVPTHKFAYCAQDGCDKLVALEIDWNPEVTVYKLTQ